MNAGCARGQTSVSSTAAARASGSARGGSVRTWALWFGMNSECNAVSNAVQCGEEVRARIFSKHDTKRQTSRSAAFPTRYVYERNSRRIGTLGGPIRAGGATSAHTYSPMLRAVKPSRATLTEPRDSSGAMTASATGKRYASPATPQSASSAILHVATKVFGTRQP